MSRSKLISTSAVLAFTAFSAAHAQAQDNSASAPAATAAVPQATNAQGGIEDIVVTAQRQQSSVQKTPIAITAVGGELLKDRGIADLDALTRSIPNVNFTRLASDARIFIRGIGLEGIGAGADGRVAVYTDEVVNARPAAALTSLFDVSRVEVLRGPQGTLYGRNATAGAVNIISNDPTRNFEGYAALTVGNYNLIRGEGAISGPLSDTISARLSFQTADRDGFGKNITTGNPVDSERSRAFRAKVRFEPSDSFHFTLTGDYRWEKDNQGGYAFVRDNPFFPDADVAAGFAHPTNPRDRAGDDQLFYMENYGITGTAVFQLADRIELTSITGYRHVDQAGRGNVDDSTSLGTSLDLANNASQFSQELRLSAKRGPIDLVAGAYYFHEKNSFYLNQGASGLYFGGPQFPRYQGFGQGGTQKTDAYALFAQATIHVTDDFGIDIGGRYSYEKRAVDQYNQLDFINAYAFRRPLATNCTPGTPGFNPPNPNFVPGSTCLLVSGTDSNHWSQFDPKVAIHYQFTPTIMGYASYSRGFKSGGYDLGALKPSYNPEKIVDYEAGIKADLFDRRLRVNVGGFYYDYTNLQLTVLKLSPTPGPVTLNAGKAKVYGAEVEITALPVDDLRLSLNLAYLHTEYTDLFDNNQLGLPETDPRGTDLSGNQFTSAPKYKAVGEVGYTFHPGFADVTPRAELSYTSRVQLSQFNYSFQSQAPRWELNLFLDFVKKDNWTVSLFGRNVTNKLFYVSEVLSAPFFGSPVVGIPAPPRTFGLSVTKHF